MPANLPPQYGAAEQRFREAKNTAEKIACLEEMLRIIPKHKGTDHLQADIKSRLAKLRKEGSKKTGPQRGPTNLIPKEGAGQVVLVGSPNSGKSSLVAALTKARPEIAEYPHTTLKSTPGMMYFEEVPIQLIDLPPISEEYSEPWLWDSIHRADLVWLVLSGRSPLSDLERLEPLLAERQIKLYPAGEELSGDLEPGWHYKEFLSLATHADLDEAAENLEIFLELIEARINPLPISSKTEAGLPELTRATFEGLGIIRVFTKLPGQPPDLKEPYTLPLGATVFDLAVRIHKEIADKMTRARVWPWGEENGRQVNREYLLTDRDIVEISI